MRVAKWALSGLENELYNFNDINSWDRADAIADCSDEELMELASQILDLQEAVLSEVDLRNMLGIYQDMEAIKFSGRY